MKNRKKDTRWLVRVALLAAIEILSGQHPSGLIPLPLIKATTIHIPVIMGAMLLGPWRGAFWAACSASAPSGATPFARGLLSFAFSPLLATSGRTGGGKGPLDRLWLPHAHRGGGRLAVDHSEEAPGQRPGWPCRWWGSSGALTNTGLVMGSIFSPLPGSTPPPRTWPWRRCWPASWPP